MVDKAIGDSVLVKTHICDTDLEGNRFVKLVTATGAQPHVVYAGAGEAAVGVNRDKNSSGRLCDVVVMGIWPVLASVNIAAGQAVASDVNGQAAVAASTNQVLGQAMTDANSGDYCWVLLQLGGIF